MLAGIRSSIYSRRLQRPCNVPAAWEAAPQLMLQGCHNITFTQVPMSPSEFTYRSLYGAIIIIIPRTPLTPLLTMSPIAHTCSNSCSSSWELRIWAPLMKTRTQTSRCHLCCHRRHRDSHPQVLYLKGPAAAVATAGKQTRQRPIRMVKSQITVEVTEDEAKLVGSASR